SNVTFLPVQPFERVGDFFNAADMLIVPMNEPHLVGTLPVKIYDAMACELPVLVAATGEPRWLVEDSRAGIAVDPADYESMRQAILTLRSDPDLRQRYGNNGRRAAVERYALDIQIERFVRAFAAVQAPPKPAPKRI
ncbi:MAG: glycosyltransferase, partial [Anaerolineae bacterium]|nr:glycosyltransferase [Anaerolineae bacterium]